MAGVKLPPPGPQMPGNYPVVGPHYHQLGEQTQAGLIYEPYGDYYYYDPKTKNQYDSAHGVGPKKPPGFAATYGPVAGVIGGSALAQYVVNGHPVKDLQNTFGLGGDKPTVPTNTAPPPGGAPSVTPQPTAPAVTPQPAVPTDSSNTFGLGSGPNQAAPGAAGGGAALASAGPGSAVGSGLADTFALGAGQGSVGASSSSAAPAASGIGSAGAILPWIGVAGIAATYGANDVAHASPILQGHGSSDDWIKTGLNSNLLTAWAPPVLDAIGVNFSTGKDKDQQLRDGMRDFWKKTGVVDDKYNVTLADGSKVDIGKDGSIQSYNIDFKDPRASQAAAWGNLVSVLDFGKQSDKLTSDSAGLLGQAAMKSGDVGQNFQAMLKQRGLDYNSARQLLTDAVQKGNLDQHTADINLNALDQLYQVNAYGNGKPPPSSAIIQPGPQQPAQQPTQTFGMPHPMDTAPKPQPSFGMQAPGNPKMPGYGYHPGLLMR